MGRRIRQRANMDQTTSYCNYFAFNALGWSVIPTFLHFTWYSSLTRVLPGSQIPLYFTGGMLSYMAADIGGKALTQSSWFPVCNTLAVASVAPFSGYLQDIFGRRNITLVGSILIMAGCAIVGTAHSFGQTIVGMTLAGAGAGIGELTALAGFVTLLFTLTYYFH